MKDYLGFTDSFTLHFQVYSCVLVSGVDTGVPQPMSNSDRVDTSLQQTDSSAVTDAMGVKSFSSQAWNVGLSPVTIFRKYVANAETCKWLSSMVSE